MAALFPVVETDAQVAVTTASSVGIVADERESAWSLMARVAQAIDAQDPTFALTFAEATKRLTLSRGSVYQMTQSAAASTLTGFGNVNTGASSYTGGVLSTVLVVEGLRMAPPGWSTEKGAVAADASAVSTPRWTTGTVSLAMAVNYADAFNALKTIRNGVWDVVSDGVWLGRFRVTGASLEPQGRLPGIVEARVTGVAVP